MVRSLTMALAAVLMLAMGTTLSAQKFPALDKSPMDAAYYPVRAAFRGMAKTEEEKKAGMPVVRVLYSRPLKNDREVAGKLIPYNEIWRAGANESTEIKFYKDVTFGSTMVKAGTYSLFVKATEKEWTVILNSDTDSWGGYSYKSANDVASVTVPVQAATDAIEAFSILFEKSDDGAHMLMGWDKLLVRVPMKF